MAEYISREKAIKELREVYENEYPTASGDFDEYASHDVPNVLRNIPAADVQPVKHGKWEEEDTMPYDNFVVCSECGMNLSPQNYTKEEWQESFKYCPCCGARMDGGAKND